jgi:hypothetical protein
MKIIRYTELLNEGSKRADMTTLVVKIGDKTFFNRDASNTFVEVIDFISKKIGIEKFISDNIDSINGIKVIGLKEEDFTRQYIRLKLSSDGSFLINTHSSTESKKAALEYLFKFYSIEGTIEVRNRTSIGSDSETDGFDIDESDIDESDIDGVKETPFIVKTRSEFWTYFLSIINDSTNKFKNRTRGSEAWLSAPTGINGIGYACVITGKYAKIDFGFYKEKSDNKKIFDWLYSQKSNIEQKFGKELSWERKDDKRGSVISYKLSPINAYDKSNWKAIMAFFVTYFPKFEETFDSYISEIPNILSSEEIKKASDFVEKPIEKSVINPFGGESTKNSDKNTSAICVLGESGAGKTYRIERTLENENHISEIIIPSSSTTNLLVQYTKGEYVLSRLGNFILKANSDKSHYYTIVFDECHKYIEMINDELLQCISTKRNDGLRFISLDPVTDKLFSELPEKNGRRLIPDNLGFIFISSKEAIIRDNSDFYNRVDIITINKSDREIDFAIEILKNKIEGRKDEEYSME